MAYFGNTSRFAGDPGLFDTLKRLGGAVIRGVTGIPGSVIGEFVGGSPRSQTPNFVPPRGGAGLTVGQAVRGGAFAGAAAGGFAASRNGKPMGCPSGYHLNRSSYFLRDGTFIPEGTRMVRNRTRNQYNRKAATKAASRLKSLGTGMKTIRKSVKAAAKELG